MNSIWKCSIEDVHIFKWPGNMYPDEPDFSKITYASSHEVAMLIIVMAFLTLTAIIIHLWNIKRRRAQETPVYIELMDTAVALDLISLQRSCDLKLKLYRSIYNITRNLERYHKKLKNKIPADRESGLTKILSKQINLAYHILYNPEIMHLLYDTEDTKISEQGRVAIQSFSEQLYTTLLNYGKTLSIDKQKQFFNYTQNPENFVSHA